MFVNGLAVFCRSGWFHNASWAISLVGNVVLSLRPGGGDALTRGLNEVRRKQTAEH